MLYTEYAKSAERHLEVCTNLVSILKNEYHTRDELSPREIKREGELLGDLYYLSGYIIECVYSYALCKYIGMNPSLPLKDQLPLGSVCHKQNQIGSRNTPDATHALDRDKHKMSVSSIGYFAEKSISFNGQSVSSIPILGGSNMSSPAAQILFDEWSAQIRYEINQTLYCDNVFAFFEACEEIYRLTRQIITADYPH